MVGFNFYQTSTLAMKSNAHALKTIGQNIANVNTGGFKRTDTHFETLLSETLDTNLSDLGGVRPKDYQVIDQQGVITATSRNLDLAISGDGFYQLSDSLTTFNQENLFYTRDGSFRVVTSDATSSVTADDGSAITINNGYLADKNGYYLLGWTPETDGSFSNTGTPAPMRVDSYAFTTVFQPTTTVKLSLNLPSNALVITDHAATVLNANNGNTNPEMNAYTVDVVDSNGKKQAANLNFTKSATNQWEVSATTSRLASPKTSSLIIQGIVEAGDTYKVTVNGNAVSYTTTGAETDLASVRANIVAAINADTVVGNRVTASAGVAGGEITLKEIPGSKTAQIDTITIAGIVEAGDQYTITVGGNQISYTATGAETGLADVRDGLLAAVTANAGASALVTAAAGVGNGKITLTAIAAGTPFSSTATANIKGATTDNTATSGTTLLNDDGSTLITQGSASLAGAVAQIDTITFAGNVAQKDTITLAGTIETGDVYSATINGTIVSYTATGAEGSINDIRDGLVTAVNGNAIASGIVTATAAGAGVFTLVGKTPGSSITTTASATNVAAGINDNSATLVNTISSTGTVESGDIYTTIINGINVSYTATGAEVDMDGIRDALVNAINSNVNVNAIVSATVAGTGAFTLKGQTEGSTLITSASVTNVLAGVDDSVLTLVNSTPAVAVTNDNNIVTASGTNYQTSAAQTFNFSQMGVISTNPAALNFALGFADGATSTFNLDISAFTQFGDDFLTYDINNDGLAQSNMIDFSFDARGHVLGKFDDATERIIYKLPLSQFTNPNGLEVMNGMVFKESFNSGAAQTVAADLTGSASFSPFALELSNVDITSEFTKMMMVQNAYNSNATVFKTVDEMVMVARDLKA